ncbi:hypothetical protein AB1Y20_002971 [Prymnesium parvum]|uniref:monoamine oxidase n=1 Tax=Prymnesium parvum TaxID=97485 RepID=A0AB34JA36_PRYPA
MRAAPPVDVAIIGAGLAGLVCAEELQRVLGARARVVLLDARARVGGRLASTRGGVDLGGSWLWPADRHVAALARRLGVRTVAQHLEGQVLLRRAPGAPTQRLGLVGADVAMCGADARRLAGGYAALVDGLARCVGGEALLLRTQAVALSAPSGGGRVRIRYRRSGEGGEEEGALDAARVVLAAPPRVLLETVRFDPPLAEAQRRAMRATPTWAGDWGKVVATFRTNFWRAAGLSGYAISEGAPISMWWEGAAEEMGEKVNALVGVSFGEQTARLAQLADGDAGVAAAPRETQPAGLSEDINEVRTGKFFSWIQSELAAIYGEKASSELESVHYKLWRSDPFAFGTTAGATDKGDPRAKYGNLALKQPTEWGVHFAGTETEHEYGHCEGAIISGLRAASEVAGALQGGPLVADD